MKFYMVFRYGESDSELIFDQSFSDVFTDLENAIKLKDKLNQREKSRYQQRHRDTPGLRFTKRWDVMYMETRDDLKDSSND
jgi:hypothetical protein